VAAFAKAETPSRAVRHAVSPPRDAARAKVETPSLAARQAVSPPRVVAPANAVPPVATGLQIQVFMLFNALSKAAAICSDTLAKSGS
jgi:hypothetical protein